ncbi:MAG: Wzz/FepE/Etk N-terminal domain-containing protein [Bacteroidia bacterium]
METFERESKDLERLLVFFCTRWKTLLLAALAGCLAGVVIAWFVPPRYTSGGIIYPARFPDTLTFVHNSRLGIELYTDRVVQLLRSERVGDALEKKFGDISAVDIVVFRTALLSIEIAVTSGDPGYSAEIANSIIGMTDSLRKEVFRETWPVEKIYVVDYARPEPEAVSPLLWKYGLSGAIINILLLIGFLAYSKFSKTVK